MKNVNCEKGFCYNCLFFYLIIYILFLRIFVVLFRYILFCFKFRFIIVFEVIVVKWWLWFIISVFCSFLWMILIWCYCLSCKVKFVDILVMFCLRLNLL